MLGAIIEGIGYGLIMSILAGPIFFTIMQVGIERGSKAAVVLSAGQWFSDISYILLVFFGSQYVLVLVNDETARQQFITYVGTGGSILLIGMGISLLLAAPPRPDQAQHIKERSLWGLFAKGWLINTINPSPILFWMTLMGSTMLKQYSQLESILLFVGVMGTVIGTDLLKIYAAKSIRHWLQPQKLIYIRRIAAVALLVFGLLLIIKIYFS